MYCGLHLLRLQGISRTLINQYIQAEYNTQELTSWETLPHFSLSLSTLQFTIIIYNNNWHKQWYGNEDNYHC